MGFIDAHWFWIAAGFALLALETAAPGIFLFWIGLAAIASGLIVWVVPMGFTAQLVTFAVLGLGAILVGRQVQGSQKDEVTDAPHLHERGKALIGKVFTLETAIIKGAGSVKIGDSVWRVTGDDRPAGERVKVTAIDGGTLVVEGA
ncbi:MAG: NfeD family protein [Beijerinckiaceae bacterium]